MMRALLEETSTKLKVARAAAGEVQSRLSAAIGADRIRSAGNCSLLLEPVNRIIHILLARGDIAVTIGREYANRGKSLSTRARSMQAENIIALQIRVAVSRIVWGGRRYRGTAAAARRMRPRLLSEGELDTMSKWLSYCPQLPHQSGFRVGVSRSRAQSIYPGPSPQLVQGGVPSSERKTASGFHNST